MATVTRKSLGNKAFNISSTALSNHIRYKESKVWQCDDSPTGAHHYVKTDVWSCKYCRCVQNWQDNAIQGGLGIDNVGKTELEELLEQEIVD